MPTRRVASSSGPFTAPKGVAPNLSIGTGLVIIVSTQAHLTRVSPLSRPGIKPGIRPVIRETPGRRTRSCGLGFLLPFGCRRSLLGSSCSRPGSWAFLTVGLPPTATPGRTPSGFPRSTLTRYDRVGCLLYPGDGGAHPGPDAVPGQRLPHHNGMSLHSAITSHHGATIHEASTKVHAIHPSGLPLTRDPQAGQGSFGVSLGLRTLPLPATHAKGGARHRARARDYTTDITSALLTASPLAKCDLVSQRQKSEPL